MSEHYVANDHEWASYKVKFGKNYQEHEEASKLVVKITFKYFLYMIIFII